MATSEGAGGRADLETVARHTGAGLPELANRTAPHHRDEGKVRSARHRGGLAGRDGNVALPPAPASWLRGQRPENRTEPYGEPRCCPPEPQNQHLAIRREAWRLAPPAARS